MTKQKKPQSGNALFLILIAIFLLGALTVLLTRQSSTTEETGETERSSIKASEILRYAVSIEAGVSRLLSQGCSENELSLNSRFNSNGTENTSSPYYNSRSPSDFSCHIFHQNGAGMNYKKMDTSALDSTYAARPDYGDWIFNSRLAVGNVGSPGYTKTELVVIAPYISNGLCMEINKMVSMPLANPAISPKEDDSEQSYFVEKFSGLYDVPGYRTLDGWGSGSGILNGRKTGCTRPTDEDSYYIYHVLHAR